MLRSHAGEHADTDWRSTEGAADGLRQRVLDDPRDADSNSSSSSEEHCEARWPTKRPVRIADVFFANTGV